MMRFPRISVSSYVRLRCATRHRGLEPCRWVVRWLMRLENVTRDAFKGNFCDPISLSCRGSSSERDTAVLARTRGREDAFCSCFWQGKYHGRSSLVSHSIPVSSPFFIHKPTLRTHTPFSTFEACTSGRCVKPVPPTKIVDQSIGRHIGSCEDSVPSEDVLAYINTIPGAQGRHTTPSH